VALVGTRMAGLRPVVNDEQLAVLRILVDRRRSLGEDHTRMVSQLHHLLLELIPGGAKKDLSARQAKALLATVRPRDAAGKTRRRVAAELISDLERVYARKKAANKELIELVAETGTGLLNLNGIGPSGAARLLVEVGDITRFPNKAHFASWTGTAPIDASSGDQIRHRLSRGGNRQINRVLHIMAASRSATPVPAATTTNARRQTANHPWRPCAAQTQTLRHRLPTDAQRRHQPHRAALSPAPSTRDGDGPGRTPGNVYKLQRDQLTSPHRLFGEVTYRTRQHSAYDPSAHSVFTQRGAKSGKDRTST
jgi:transposase